MKKEKFSKKQGPQTSFKKPEPTPKPGERVYFVSRDFVATKAPLTDTFVGMPMPAMVLPPVEEGREAAVVEAVAEDLAEFNPLVRVSTAKITSGGGYSYATFGVLYSDDRTSVSYDDAEFANESLRIEAKFLGRDLPAEEKDDASKDTPSTGSRRAVAALGIAALAATGVAITAKRAKK